MQFKFPTILDSFQPKIDTLRQTPIRVIDRGGGEASVCLHVEGGMYSDELSQIVGHLVTKM